MCYDVIASRWTLNVIIFCFKARELDRERCRPILINSSYIRPRICDSVSRVHAYRRWRWPVAMATRLSWQQRLVGMATRHRLRGLPGRYTAAMFRTVTDSRVKRKKCAAEFGLCNSLVPEHGRRHKESKIENILMFVFHSAQTFVWFFVAKELLSCSMIGNLHAPFYIRNSARGLTPNLTERERETGVRLHDSKIYSNKRYNNKYTSNGMVMVRCGWWLQWEFIPMDTRRHDSLWLEILRGERASRDFNHYNVIMTSTECHERLLRHQVRRLTRRNPWRQKDNDVIIIE